MKHIALLLITTSLAFSQGNVIMYVEGKHDFTVLIETNGTQFIHSTNAPQSYSLGSNEFRIKVTPLDPHVDYAVGVRLTKDGHNWGGSDPRYAKYKPKGNVIYLRRDVDGKLKFR